MATSSTASVARRGVLLDRLDPVPVGAGEPLRAAPGRARRASRSGAPCAAAVLAGQQAVLQREERQDAERRTPRTPGTHLGLDGAVEQRVAVLAPLTKPLAAPARPRRSQSRVGDAARPAKFGAAEVADLALARPADGRRRPERRRLLPMRRGDVRSELGQLVQVRCGRSEPSSRSRPAARQRSTADVAPRRPRRRESAPVVAPACPCRTSSATHELVALPAQRLAEQLLARRPGRRRRTMSRGVEQRHARRRGSLSGSSDWSRTPSRSDAAG